MAAWWTCRVCGKRVEEETRLIGKAVSAHKRLHEGPSVQRYAWLDAMNRAWWLEHGGRMEPNDQQPDVETEREKAAYNRGFEDGVRAQQKALAAALTVGEGYREVSQYGTDPTWPVPGASER